MKHTRKLVSAVVAVAIVAIGVMTAASQAQAASNAWKDFFSQDEATAIKKMVGSYIQNQLEDGKKDWKGVISGKAIDNGAIDSKKVDSSITKKKIYTGTMPTSATGADKVIIDDEEGTTDYFKKISSDAVELNNNPQIALYKKIDESSFDASVLGINSNIWSQNSSDLYFSEGEIWIRYGHVETGIEEWTQHVLDYKVSVNY